LPFAPAPVPDKLAQRRESPGGEIGGTAELHDVIRPDSSADPDAGRSRYAAFLSYCHADRAQAEALHRFLETYRLPRDLPGLADGVLPVEERLRPVFVDRADMPAGTDLRDEIDAALAASGALIVLCSPAAGKSRWVDLEIERFKQQHGDTRVFAVIIDGIAHGSEAPDTAARECFPPALRTRQTPHGPVRADPAAVDLRRSGDGVQIGRLRLVAGLVGVPLDQLVHRDARRRHRRTLALLIGLSLALAGTSALALYALAARNEAQRQRFAAEGMIEFMIGDLRKTLEPMGRLSAMDPLGQRALDYYRRQDAGALDADSLGRRARVLQLVGEIQDQRGHLDTALGYFQIAAGTTSELLERSPADPKRIFDHAQSVYWVGYIAYRRGNYGVAEPAFQEYRRMAERLVEVAPGDPAYVAEKGYAYSNLGTMWFEMGRNAEAEAAFRQALTVSIQLASGTDASSIERYDLSQAHAWLADALARQGKLDAAWKEREMERALLEAILSKDPANIKARAALTNGKRMQGNMASLRGDPALAQRLAGDAARESKAIAAIDPSNVEAASRAASANIDFGEILMDNDEADLAAEALAAARRYASQMTVGDRGIAQWQMIAVRELLLRSRIATARRQPQEALALAGAAKARIGIIPVDGRNASDTKWLINLAQLRTGEGLLAGGKRKEAIEQFNLILDDHAEASDGPRSARVRERATILARTKP
jgi:tetratricopeptide (TPR) repeat protein